ncbi:hypothetical protein [Delftia lacustris]|uniref:Uncharacterized protein n=1 Tax=Delftia lacustris TaxID=558537 RepID=A0A1H3MBP1_9BURK|nr:hypothetical protein [Delftia lacustris]SDY74111.1 hypothetical protein SAMN05421547_107204 [Delftia lacustris]
MPSFQVGAACYPTQIQAAQVVASSQVGSIVQQGGSAHVVELMSVNPTSITYGLRPVSGGPLVEVVSAFQAQPCGLLQASEGLALGWMVGGVWIVVYGLMFIARTVFHVGDGGNDGNT